MTAKKQPSDAIKKPLAKAQKDTLFVDVEDDITALINNVKKSSSSIVAIVLPKNAHVLQSIVNMKLLKRSAMRSKKNIALITTDNSVQTLAGIAGVHVAETANSKPFIPTVSIEDVDNEQNDSVVQMSDAEEETVGVDGNDDTTETSTDSSQVPEQSNKKIESIKSKNKKFKVPDFGSFQVRLFMGLGVAILLFTLWFIGFVVMPKATIVVTTNTQNVPISDDITLDYSDSSTLDIDERIIPAKKVTTEKSSEASEQATGEKNIGDKASGSVTMSAQVCGAISSPATVPKGTGVSSNGNTYITQEDADFSFSSFDGACLNFQGDTVDIIAQDSGEKYNVAKDSSFAVSGRSDVSAVGSASGGTTEIVTVVSEEDIENAKDSLGDAGRGEALQQLSQELADLGYEAMDSSLSISEPVYTTTPKVGEEADSVIVRQVVTYELSGYRSEDLQALLDTVLAETLSEESESKNVSNNGIEGVSFEAVENNKYTFSTIATIGPSLDTEALKEEFAGKKRGEIIDKLESINGVSSAEVTYSPMWITTTPKSAQKITIQIQSQ